MAITPVLITLALLGFVAWLITRIAMPAKVQQVIIAVVVVIAIIYVLQVLGVNTGLPKLHL